MGDSISLFRELAYSRELIAIDSATRCYVLTIEKSLIRFNVFFCRDLLFVKKYIMLPFIFLNKCFYDEPVGIFRAWSKGDHKWEIRSSNIGVVLSLLFEYLLQTYYIIDCERHFRSDTFLHVWYIYSMKNSTYLIYFRSINQFPKHLILYHWLFVLYLISASRAWWGKCDGRGDTHRSCIHRQYLTAWHKHSHNYEQKTCFRTSPFPIRFEEKSMLWSNTEGLIMFSLQLLSLLEALSSLANPHGFFHDQSAFWCPVHVPTATTHGFYDCW